MNKFVAGWMGRVIFVVMAILAACFAAGAVFVLIWLAIPAVHAAVEQTTLDIDVGFANTTLTEPFLYTAMALGFGWAGGYAITQGRKGYIADKMFAEFERQMEGRCPSETGVYRAVERSIDYKLYDWRIRCEAVAITAVLTWMSLFGWCREWLLWEQIMLYGLFNGLLTIVSFHAWRKFIVPMIFKKRRAE